MQGVAWSAPAHRALEGKLSLALLKIHAAGVLHGDLHEGNILVTPDHRVLILDFAGAQLHPTPKRLREERRSINYGQSWEVGCL